jgi:hypothetical protein
MATFHSAFHLRPSDARVVLIYLLVVEQSNLLLGVCYLLIVAFSFFIFIGPMVLHSLHHREREDWCPVAPTWNITENPYENPDYITDPCRYERLPILLYFTLEECDVCGRLLISVFLGGFIG